jgi:hypothetical protein
MHIISLFFDHYIAMIVTIVFIIWLYIDLFELYDEIINLYKSIVLFLIFNKEILLQIKIFLIID